jgi:hypothetical protein
MKSPLAEAISSSLNLFRADGNVHEESSVGREYFVASYSDPEDFSFLWSFWEDPTAGKDESERSEGPPNGKIIKWLESAAESKHVFLLWDGFPDSPTVGNIHLGTYLTPYDWVIALGDCLSAYRPDLGKTRFRVSIIDVAGRSEDSDSFRLFRRFHDGPGGLFSWVSICRIDDEGESQNWIHRLLSDTLAFDLPSREPVESRAAIEANVDTQILRRIWSARILTPSNPRDRHSLANLIGPLILISGMAGLPPNSRAFASPCVTALLTLLRTFGLLPPPSERTSAPWIEYDQELAGNRPAFVLLDDMADLGWRDFLRFSLGIVDTDKGGESFVVLDAPEAKKLGIRGEQSLIDLLTDDSGHLRVNKGIDLCSFTDDAILFLDLRLFSQRTTDDEMQFFRRVLELAKQAEDNDGSRTDLPWKGFTTRELDAVSQCLTTRKVEDEDYFIALTLLPRLIALVDPMLPIILFSSTGQKRIAESLNDYGTIITDFDKPRFFGGIAANLIQDIRHRFETAVNRATRFLKGRSVCRRLNRGTGPNRNNGRRYFVEMFFDEADSISDMNFRVGGIALIYDDEEEAAKFNEEMLSRGLRWGSTDIEREPDPAGPFINKRMPQNLYESIVYTPVNKLRSELKLEPLIGFALIAPEDVAWQDSTDLTSPACLDNLYRDLVAQALEALFYEVLPASVGQEEPCFTCAIHLATRLRFKSSIDDPRVWDDADEMNITASYGIRKRIDRQGEPFFQSINSDSVHPLVAHVRSLMPNAEISIRKARGSRLRYGIDGSFPEDLPRPAHLLADVVVSRAIREGHVEFRTWLRRGFSSVADEKFRETLEACRHARANRHVEAVLHAYKATQVPSKTKNQDLAWWAIPRLSRSVRSLSGPQFVELCSRLSA